MKDFSLNSGERQIATELVDIRFDHRVRYEMALNFLRDKKHCFGLDMFCGNGYGSYYIAKELSGTIILGIDGSKEAVECADENYMISNNFFAYKLFPFFLPKKSFDYIICFESIEHIEDDIKMIDLLISSLKPNGYLFLSVPNEVVHSLKLNPHPFHIRHYTSANVENLVNGRLKLLTWFGQDTYQFIDGIQQMEFLSEEKMKLKQEVEGQVNIYVYQK